VSGSYKEDENSKGVIKGWEKIADPTGNAAQDNSAWMMNNEPKLWSAFIKREMRKLNGETTTDLDALADQFLAETKRRLNEIQK